MPVETFHCVAEARADTGPRGRRRAFHQVNQLLSRNKTTRATPHVSVAYGPTLQTSKTKRRRGVAPIKPNPTAGADRHSPLALFLVSSHSHTATACPRPRREGFLARSPPSSRLVSLSRFLAFLPSLSTTYQGPSYLRSCPTNRASHAPRLRGSAQFRFPLTMTSAMSVCRSSCPNCPPETDILSQTLSPVTRPAHIATATLMPRLLVC